MNTSAIVQKLWNYCNVLRDDGMSYGDYVEQLTYLLFLKMADERAGAPYNQESPISAGYDWPSLLERDGDELFVHYRRTLEKLGAANRHERKVLWSEKRLDGRWRAYSYDELVARDKASLDIFWLKDESLEDSENLPAPEVIAQEMIEDLEAALEQLRSIAADLGSKPAA